MGSKSEALVYRLSATNKALEKDLAKAKRSLSKFQGQSNTISKGIARSMSGMFGVFTAGMILRDVGQTVVGFEKQMDKVRAISGATEQEIKELSNSAIELGRVSKFTALEIGVLQEELARLGFTSRQITDSTDAIRKLATVADSELGEAAKSLAGTMNSFNLEAKESEEVANIMAESFSKSALDLEKFTVGMANVGATARASGFSLSQTTAMLGILTNANIDASKAGTDLRKIFTELSLQNLTLEEAFNKIQNSTDKVKTSFELFGQRAQTSAIILAENAEKLKTLQGELSDSNKELNEMVDIMEDNLITDLQKLKSAWDGFILSLEKGDGVGTKALRGLSKGFTDLLNGLSDWDKFTKGGGLSFLPGQTPEDKAALKEFERIINGTTFNNVSVETMKYAEAIKTIDKRLRAFTQNKYYDKISDSVESYKKQLKKANDERVKELNLIQNIRAMKKLAEMEAAIRARKKLAVTYQKLDFAAPKMDDPFSFGKSYSGRTFKDLVTRQRKEFLESIQQMKDVVPLYEQEMQALADDLNSIINDTIGNALSNGIATAFNTGNLELAFASFLNTIGDGLQRFGATLVAFGVALEAFKNLDGPAKVVAGIAAIAAGALAKKAASNLSASASAGVGGGGPSGSFQNNALQGQSFSFEEITFRVEGADLVAALNEGNRLKGRGAA